MASWARNKSQFKTLPVLRWRHKRQEPGRRYLSPARRRITGMAVVGELHRHEPPARFRRTHGSRRPGQPNRLLKNSQIYASPWKRGPSVEARPFSGRAALQGRVSPVKSVWALALVVVLRHRIEFFRSLLRQGHRLSGE